MNLIYTPNMEGSHVNTPPIAGKYVSWPDAKLRSTPPPPPQQPLLSVAAPLIKNQGGPASVA